MFINHFLGDVTGVIDTSGNLVVQYAYDSWGKVLSTTGSMANTVGTLNPIRYRGYYYDVETGLYYLQSRYYDPETGRFISPDVIAEGGNIYTYCLNDPVNRSDESGYLSRRDKNIIKIAIGVVTTVAAVAITVATGGAALPVIAGVAASTLIGAGISAGITALQGGSDAEIFDSAVDGAIDGFMWGGISAFASASVGAITSSLNATKVANNVSTRSTNFTQGACFIAGTLILTEKGIKEIENIKIGDYVLSYNERTGDKEYKKVVNTFKYLKTELYHIITNDNQTISVTPEHPFYVFGEGWIMAKDLMVGDMLSGLSGNTVSIREIRHEFLKEPILVYNFEVSENHNYYVLGETTAKSSSFVLVHNLCSAFNPKANAIHAAQYKAPGGATVTAYQQSNGLMYARDITGHGGSIYKVLKPTKGNKYLKVLGDANAIGQFIVNKHSSKANVLFEVIKWIF